MVTLNAFITRSARGSQSQAPSHASSSPSRVLLTPKSHFAASRTLEKGKQKAAEPQSIDQEPASELVKAFPKGQGNQGLDFVVNWNNIWLGTEKLHPNRLGYRVKHKSALKSTRAQGAIWSHGADLVYNTDDGKDTVIWLCRLCHQKDDRKAAKVVNSHNHISRHLLNVHRIDVNKGLLPDPPSTPSSPWVASINLPGSRRGVAHNVWQEEELQSCLVDWVILNDVSFNNASSAELRVLLSWNRLDLLRALPSSPSTISKYITHSLTLRIEAIQTLLNTAISKIALSLDVWTSPNHYSFLGVVAHFIDANNKPRDVLIAFKNLFGDHTGLHQSSHIATVIQRYEIVDQVHCFVADNASNNNQTFICGLNRYLQTDYTLDARIRCAGHIIAIVVKAVIYGKGVSKFEEELAQAAPREQFELYRRHGVVGKLHNFVNAVLASHKRRELFKTVQLELAEEDSLWTFGTLNLVRDGGIRWNSVYLMLLRCAELREPISRFIRKLQRTDVAGEGDDGDAYDPLLDELSDEEWETVDRLKNFLERFHRATLKLEGKTSTSAYGALWQTILQLQLLDNHLRAALSAAATLPVRDDYLHSAASYGLERLTTYWNKLVLEVDISYPCVALALNPACRLLWFKDHWRHHETWHKKAESSIKAVYARYLQEEEDREDQDEATYRKVPHAGRIDDGDPDLQAILAVNTALLTGNRGHKKLKRQTELQLYFDEIAQDINEGRMELQLPLIWWQTIGYKRYPILYKIALDFLSIPATSCECERAFSAAKRTISVDRNRLAPATIEALQLQKNWLRSGVVNSPLLALAEGVQTRARAECEAAVQRLEGKIDDFLDAGYTVDDDIPIGDSQESLMAPFSSQISDI